MCFNAFISPVLFSWLSPLSAEASSYPTTILAAFRNAASANSARVLVLAAMEPFEKMLCFGVPLTMSLIR